MPPFRVIICDDDPGTRELFRNWCRSVNLRVEDAEDGKTLFGKLLVFKPHIIILDIELPDINGITCIEKIRKDNEYKSVKIIVITGKAYAGYEEKALKAGADAFMLKPVNPKELFKTISEFYKPEAADGSILDDKEIPEDLVEELKRLILRADIQGFTRKLKASSTLIRQELISSLLNLARDYRYNEIIETLDKSLTKGKESNGDVSKQSIPRQ
ncbi:MAG: response regulator [Thermodesulforhabdaceae bacterium]